jgi:hypothetical protein
VHLAADEGVVTRIDAWLKRSSSPLSIPARPDLSLESEAGREAHSMAEGLLAPSIGSDWMHELAWAEWDPPDGLVVGESHHFDGIAPCVGPPRQQGYWIPVTVTFRREPSNPYDGNAIMAIVNARLVGYINRPRAAEVAPLMDATGVSEFELAGVIIGGFLNDDSEWPERNSFGVFVWLDKRVSAAPPIAPSREARAWPPKPEALVATDRVAS